MIGSIGSHAAQTSTRPNDVSRALPLAVVAPNVVEAIVDRR
jgi:hypothetical protein